VTSATDVATLTFDVPVIVDGDINLVVAGGPVFVSQEIISNTVVQLTFDAALAGKTYNLGAGDPAISTFQGGSNSSASGTF